MLFYLGLAARKPVFNGLQTTKAQTSGHGQGDFGHSFLGDFGRSCLHSYLGDYGHNFQGHFGHSFQGHFGHSFLILDTVF